MAARQIARPNERRITNIGSRYSAFPAAATRSVYRAKYHAMNSSSARLGPNTSSTCLTVSARRISGRGLQRQRRAVPEYYESIGYRSRDRVGSAVIRASGIIRSRFRPGP